MNGKELIDTAKERRSEAILPKLIPILLVKLEAEGLIQRADNNRYTITTNGLKSLQSIDEMVKEFQKVAKIMQRTSMIGKFMVAKTIDTISMLSSDNINSEKKETMPVYADRVSIKHYYNNLFRCFRSRRLNRYLIYKKL